MIYLDNAATSWPKPPGTAQAMVAALQRAAGNPGRTSHQTAMHSVEIIQECRENLAQIFSVANPLRICFMASTTEALNAAIKGVLRPGDHAICSSMEHNSVWRPLHALTQSGVELSIAQADHNGLLQPESIERLIRPHTRLIVVNHASNVNGVIQPLAAIGDVARRRNILFLVDAAQSAGSLPIDVCAMQIDLLAFPGHKGLLGPQGVGGLYVSEAVEIKPFKEGGTGSHSLDPEQPREFPDRIEAGTLNLPGIAALRHATRYLLKTSLNKIAEREHRHTIKFLQGLAAINGVTVYGPPPERPRAAVVSFNIRNADPVAVAADLEKIADIACRPGWHCAGLAHRTLGTEKSGCVRLSPGAFTKDAEIEQAIAAVAELAQRS